jgi:hypothetical protein
MLLPLLVEMSNTLLEGENIIRNNKNNYWRCSIVLNQSAKPPL